MKRAAENTLAIGAAVKSVLLIAGSLCILGLGIYWAVRGDWTKALILWFIVEPIFVIVADIITGLVLLPLVGAAQALGRRS